jgi:hypothetical protein
MDGGPLFARQVAAGGAPAGESMYRRGQRRSPRLSLRLPPIRSNGAFDGDRLCDGGGPYGPIANAIDLACPG